METVLWSKMSALTSTTAMLDIQRIKIEIVSQLKSQGASAEEIKAPLNQDKRPIKPAFLNGKRREERSRAQTV